MSKKGLILSLFAVFVLMLQVASAQDAVKKQQQKIDSYRKDLALIEKKLKERYPEFEAYEGKCRFRECLHDREPGCAVAEAVQKGLISPGRHERYRTLLAEAREVWRERYD